MGPKRFARARRLLLVVLTAAECPNATFGREQFSLIEGVRLDMQVLSGTIDKIAKALGVSEGED